MKCTDTNLLVGLMLSGAGVLLLLLNLSGAGMATLDLARLRLTGLAVNAGVGQTTITLPRQGGLEARVNGGITIQQEPGR